MPAFEGKEKTALHRFNYIKEDVGNISIFSAKGILQLILTRTTPVTIKRALIISLKEISSSFLRNM